MDYLIYGIGRTACYASFLCLNQVQTKKRFKCKKNNYKNFEEYRNKLSISSKSRKTFPKMT